MTRWPTKRVHCTRIAIIIKNYTVILNHYSEGMPYLMAVTVEHGHGWQVRLRGEGDTAYMPAIQVSQEEPVVLFVHIYNSRQRTVNVTEN